MVFLHLVTKEVFFFFLIKEKQNAIRSRLFGISHKYVLVYFIESILHMNIV